MSKPTIKDAILEYCETLQQNFAVQIKAQPEDQLKPAVTHLLTEAGVATKRQVITRTEAQVKGLGARPDIGVSVNGLLCGYVELKAPEKSIDPRQFSEQDKKQWERLKSLPNLIYTNGTDWRLYQNGKQVENTSFSFGRDVTKHGTASITDEVENGLKWMLELFFCWEPIVPKNPSQLAEVLAPLCHILRDLVLDSIQDKHSNLSILANEWRNILFPDADDPRFADAYAQTLTYGLLLARFTDDEPLDLDSASKRLEQSHGLLGQAVKLLAQEEVRADISVAADLLVRAINAIDPQALANLGDDPWLYFYEDFLAKYDPKLRKDYGVYYTPPEVIRAQVHLVSELLAEKFDKALAFADKGVIFLDPAAGTGAYPLYAMQHSLGKVAERFGKGSVPTHASRVAENMHAFEILVGPYAVAHMRLTQAILDQKGKLPVEGAQIYLTDTLESPGMGERAPETLFQKRLALEHKRAQKVKAATRVLVCLGNPPYDRQERERGDTQTQLKGGWVRFGEGDAQSPQQAILSDFIEPAREAGRGVDLKNLYNDYVYFWRWGLWKVFEQGKLPGIVSFITASSYLKGPGFVGMREHMRKVLDELWIIDLEGDNLGARKSQNVFAIQTPVAIAVGVRYKGGKKKTAAKVHYAKIEGTRDAKLNALTEIASFKHLKWKSCPKGWQNPFLPSVKGDYAAWPKLTEIFPWQHSGVQYKRTWPIGETREVLEQRWKRLMKVRKNEKAALFIETRDRKAHNHYSNPFGTPSTLPALATLPADEPCPPIIRYSHRSLDRKWCIRDNRVGDFLRFVLHAVNGPKQVYMTSLLTGVLGEGSAAVATYLVPDLHHFRGSFGAKDVIPLYRDAAGTAPNVNKQLLATIQHKLGSKVSAEDLFAYVYALLSTPDYTEIFREALSEPGPRVPITKDKVLFAKTAAAGKELIWLHTYAERFVPKGKKRGIVPKGSARCVRGVPEDPEAYPEAFHFSAANQSLRVGEGRFEPVTQEVFEFSVSGFKILQSWLSYRMRKGAGRKSSELDKIRPEQWTTELTTELLELLWVLEAAVLKQTALSTLLNKIVDSEIFQESELAKPDAEEIAAPVFRADKRVKDQLDAFGDD